jgi:hypothetical protein
MADNDPVVMMELSAGITRPRSELSAEQKTGRACLQCGKADEPLRPFGVIGNLSGALHERCLEAFQGDVKVIPGRG